MEQAKVLKEEVRRLERNQEREKHLANMEYLKNIILKVLSFINSALRSNSEIIFSCVCVCVCVCSVPDSARRRGARAAGARAEHSAPTERRRADGPPSHGHSGHVLSQWTTSSGRSTRTGWSQLLVRGLPHWSPVVRVHYICNHIPFSH